MIYNFKTKPEIISHIRNKGRVTISTSDGKFVSVKIFKAEDEEIIEVLNGNDETVYINKNLITTLKLS